MSAIWTLDLFSSIITKNLLFQSLWNLSLAAAFLFIFAIPFFRANPALTYKKNLNLIHTEITNKYVGDNRVIASIGNSQNMVLGIQSEIQHGPVLRKKSAFPFLSAQAHIVVDNNAAKIISEHNKHLTFAPASTTKMMTAIVANELYDLDDVVAMPTECVDIESTKLWLPSGSSYYVKDLLASVLISSAGDSACALAASSVSLEDFITLMNKKAEELGMHDTNFTNPIGLDGSAGSNYSTAWDLYILSKELMRDPVLRDFVKTKEYSFSDVENALEVPTISNTNKLLWEVPETIGIKTGTTTGAGEVLIYRYLEDKTDLTIIVLASDNRFLDTKSLLDWTLSSYSWN